MAWKVRLEYLTKDRIDSDTFDGAAEDKRALRFAETLTKSDNSVAVGTPAPANTVVKLTVLSGAVIVAAGEDPTETTAIRYGSGDVAEFDVYKAIALHIKQAADQSGSGGSSDPDDLQSNLPHIFVYNPDGTLLSDSMTDGTTTWKMSFTYNTDGTLATSTAWVVQ